ncbi:glyoxalase [Sulfitobacter sp. F26169L]|uniref:glyoxalase n=1 Tax=Sulfitobacter sp. F26169L TaxID=2996015 RepID=UPI002260DE89|nr:glyoxalase [Sulfitobacter sp. F26169L]MCX7566002.1 glyoxalase [Sulfitobacter sp. F26169L]
MDYDSVGAAVFGQSLCGMGVNLLVKDVSAQVAFLETVFDMKSHQPTADFAIMVYGNNVFQVHSDGTYHANPLLGLVPETPPRGGGIELRLYDTDPDTACKRAEDAGATILQAPADKPHGLREAYILCDNGYAWVPSKPLNQIK